MEDQIASESRLSLGAQLPSGAGPRIEADSRPSFARRMLVAYRVLQVRLRFVMVLVVVFLVIGLWSHLRNVWDTLSHRLAGAHRAQGTISNDTEFFCPMCPGVVSDWPAICPVCNMDLVRRKKGEAVVLPEGVVARMQFSPYRVQLAGIKTAVITRQKLSREIVVAGRLVRLPASTPGKTGAGPAADIAAGSELVLECDVFAADLASLAAGRRALVAVEALPGTKPLAGIVMPEQSDSSTANGVKTDRQNATVRIRVTEPAAGLRPGMYCTARVAVPLAETEPFASSLAASQSAASAGFTAVPETAVVDTGTHRVVFVETMPGMFDGVEVTLGPRCGDFYPVVAGLEPGQKVAAIGAFLIDAEARLNPNAAASYFGAGRNAVPGAPVNETPPANKPPAKPLAGGTKKKAESQLSAADQKLAARQKVCPVTDLPLDSMGGPVAVDIEGQRVFICCEGCESRLKKDAKKYLAKLRK